MLQLVQAHVILTITVVQLHCSSEMGSTLPSDGLRGNCKGLTQVRERSGLEWRKIGEFLRCRDWNFPPLHVLWNKYSMITVMLMLSPPFELVNVP